jgi:carboxypeptidase C (cathepsin A)
MRLTPLLAALLLASPALAQPAARPEPARAEAARPAAPEVRPPLPPDSVTHHTLTLPGRTLHITATAGSFRLTDADGHAQADIAYISYTLDDADPHARPVAFAVNGGPGASSAWLHLGAMGPWRLELASPPLPSASPVPVPNADTWLDFTDLVFIDPPGTGFSRLATNAEELRRKFWSVDGDIPPLAEVVRRWTVRQGRALSPRLIVGESYGGFRGPRLVRELQTGEGLGVSALVMVSPVLDFGWPAWGTDPMSLVGRLPSMAAVAADAAGRAPDLAAVEQYAATEFLADLLRGPRDAASVDRLVAHTVALTGLDAALVRRLAARIDMYSFRRDRVRGEIGSAYDATVASPDAAPEAAWNLQPDTLLDGLRAPLTGGMLALYRTLGWQPEGEYQVMNQAVGKAWDWGHNQGNPSSIRALRVALALDPGLRVLVAHGRDDLVTPYFITKLELAQLPNIGAPDRIHLLVLPGGHMMYLRDNSRTALHEAARALFEH